MDWKNYFLKILEDAFVCRHVHGGIRERNERKSKVEVKVHKKKYEESKSKQIFLRVQKYIENYRLHIFWLTLYLLVLAGIFIERAYCKFSAVELPFLLIDLKHICG